MSAQPDMPVKGAAPEMTFTAAVNAAHAQFHAALNRLPGSRDVSVARTQLDTARLWALEAAK